ncbi:hypothetical protein [Nonomuraea candida]|uniref:hypothetical protein n=1 Tax=Nonomuraea candida TaxID=359159 RepID=UPI0005BD7F2D|nr:hypothetical protein [Nonomuraea candida]
MSGLWWQVAAWAHWAIPLAVLQTLTYLVGRRAGRVAGERERKRLAQRLETFTTILRPVAQAIRDGKPSFQMGAQDRAVLAVLVAEPGEDGDKLAALEGEFHAPSD